MANTVTFSIYRYDPDKDKKPYMQDYVLDLDEHPSVMILNGLEALKVQDPTLAFRRSCGEGVCGSDGMNINGKNGLACITHISNCGGHITLRPLPGFPVIRDLIVDMNNFYQQYERVQPYLQNNENMPAKERIQMPAERAKLDGLYECILCACCSSSCPSFWWNPDKFIGPAGLLQAARFISDSRDTEKHKRLQNLQDPFSLFRCRGIMNCVNVCPKGLTPTKAIAHIRSEMIKDVV